MTISGLPLQYVKRQIYGQYNSGDYRPVRVCSSGEIVVCSGLYVVADIAESGLHVQISGQHVFVESGVHVVADIAESGLHVQISGQHVFVESGVWLASGVSIGVVPWPEASGLGVQIQSGVHVQISGQHVYVESGVHIIGDLSVSSGLGVLISGQHVFVESGLILGSGFYPPLAPAVAGSGQVIHIGCAEDIRTGKWIQLIGGTSGSVPGSGGMSLCVSGYWCSGPIHSLVIKNRAGNDPVVIGGVNCKPYSGYGYELDASEAVNYDICDLCDVWGWGVTSGQFVTWTGTDY